MTTVALTGSASLTRQIKYLKYLTLADNWTGVPGQQVSSTGDLTSGSNSVANAASALLVAGQTVYGPGIPPGTVILSRTGNTLTMSAAATATATGAAIVGAGPCRVLLRDTDQNGAIKDQINIQPGHSEARTYPDGGLEFPGGLYIQVAAGTIRGSATGV